MALLTNKSWFHFYHLVFAVLLMYFISLHGEDIDSIRISCDTSNVDMNVSTGILDKPRYTYVIAHYATTCDIPICPSQCFCSLRNRSFISSCYNKTETSTEIIFPKNASTLYLGNLSLNAIKPFAFDGTADGWKELWLNNNSLTDLQPGLFKGLSNLTHLRLFQNKLTELREDVFVELDSLLDLDLRLNLLSSVQSGVFKGLSQLMNLSMDYNKFAELKLGIFDGLKNVQEIDVDHSLIEKVEVNVFKGQTYMLELDLDHNMISELQPGVFNELSNLEELELDDNKLTYISTFLFAGIQNLQRLILSHNMLLEINSNILLGLYNLQELYLSHNHLANLYPSLFQEAQHLTVLFIDHNFLGEIHSSMFQNLTNLKILSLAQTHLESLPSFIFRDLIRLRHLNVSRNFLKKISSQLFHRLTQLTILDLTQNPLDWVNKESFQLLQKHTIVYVDEYATCCFIKSANCSSESPPSPFISCKRLLPSLFLRVVVWVVAITTVIGNSFVIYTRCTKKTDKKLHVQHLLIKNLSLSDLIMGVYLFIILFVDLYFNEYFPTCSDSWRHSGLCKIAGALSVLSSEASVFFITLVSIDRFTCIKYSLSTTKLRENVAKLAVLFAWIIAFLISLVSVLIPLFSPDLYDASEICVGLPISRVDKYASSIKSFDLNISVKLEEPGFETGHVVETELIGSKPSMFFSIAVFTCLNLICFLTVAFCYASIFYTAIHASRKSGLRADVDREIRMAFKMAGIVLSDFCCWVIVGLLSILVQSNVFKIRPEAYAWIAIFILPINSCMNPFLYTLYILISDRRHWKPIKFKSNRPASTAMVSINTISQLAS